jgi:hypothetical protein
MKTSDLILKLGLSAVVFLTGCASSSTTTSSRTVSTPTARTAPEGTTTGTANSLANGCPLEKITWLVVSQNYSNADLSSLAQKFAEAAQSDVQKLTVMVNSGNNSPLQLSSSLRTTVESAAAKKINVSDEFYKQYANNRLAMCGVIDALQKGSIKKGESAKAAESAFKSVANSFGSLSGNLRTKAGGD